VRVSEGGPPSGVVTFLFTDIEGSTRRWESDAEAMRAALLAHDKVLRTAMEADVRGERCDRRATGVAVACADGVGATDCGPARTHLAWLLLRLAAIEPL